MIRKENLFSSRRILFEIIFLSLLISFSVHAFSLQPPVLQSPSDGSIVYTLTPTFQWNSVSGAQSYYISVTRDYDGKAINLPSKCISDTQYLPGTYDKLDTSYNSYSWIVSAYSDVNCKNDKSSSEKWNFKLKYTQPIPDSPLFTYPFDGKTFYSGNFVIPFSWTNTNAHHYRLYVQGNTNGAIFPEGMVYVTNYNWNPFGPDNYTARVKACTSADKDASTRDSQCSQPSTIHFQMLKAKVTVSFINPQDNQYYSNRNVKFEWSNAGVHHYKLKVYNLDTKQTLGPWREDTNTDTRTLDNGRYNASIQACDITNSCDDQAWILFQINDGIKCYRDSDCGVNKLTKAPYCLGSNVTNDWQYFTCKNPGTLQANCSNKIVSTLERICSTGCNATTGTCIADEFDNIDYFLISLDSFEKLRKNATSGGIVNSFPNLLSKKDEDFEAYDKLVERVFSLYKTWKNQSGLSSSTFIVVSGRSPLKNFLKYLKLPDLYKGVGGHFKDVYYTFEYDNGKVFVMLYEDVQLTVRKMGSEEAAIGVLGKIHFAFEREISSAIPGIAFSILDGFESSNDIVHKVVYAGASSAYNIAFIYIRPAGIAFLGSTVGVAAVDGYMSFLASLNPTTYSQASKNAHEFADLFYKATNPIILTSCLLSWDGKSISECFSKGTNVLDHTLFHPAYNLGCLSSSPWPILSPLSLDKTIITSSDSIKLSGTILDGNFLEFHRFDSFYYIFSPFIVNVSVRNTGNGSVYSLFPSQQMLSSAGVGAPPNSNPDPFTRGLVFLNAWFNFNFTSTNTLPPGDYSVNVKVSSFESKSYCNPDNNNDLKVLETSRDINFSVIPNIPGQSFAWKQGKSLSFNGGSSGSLIGFEKIAPNLNSNSSNLFAPRYEHASFVLNNKMFVVGGVAYPSTRYNDVWSSTDGASWNWETAITSSNGMEGVAAFVLNGKAFIFGGKGGSGGADGLPYPLSNVIYSSSDGSTWKNVGTFLIQGGIRDASSFILTINGTQKVFAVAGMDSTGTDLKSVYSSYNGINWTPEGNAQFPARIWTTTYVMFVNGIQKAFITAGLSSSGSRLNDVWSSTDGVNWKNETVDPNQIFGPTAGVDVFVLNNIAYLYVDGALWSSTDGVHWNKKYDLPGSANGMLYSSVVFNGIPYIIGGSSNINEVWKGIITSGGSPSKIINANSKYYPGSTLTNRKLSTIADSFTIEFWAKATPSIVSANGFLVWSDHEIGSPDAGAGIIVGTNVILVGEYADGYFPGVLQWIGDLSKWTHVALVYRDNTPTLYVNGKKVGTGSKSSHRVHASFYEFGSNEPGGGAGGYSGQVDELRVWKKALSEQEINRNMNETLTGRERDLVLYYNFNEDSGNQVYDISGHRNKGVISNAQWVDASWPANYKLSKK